MKLPPFALERYFAPREFTARHFLSCSDCEALALHDVLAHADPELLAMWNTLHLGYVETRGLPVWRQEIASLYRGVTSDDVMACAPAEGIFLVMTSLVRAQDVVIVQQPSYQSLSSISESMGARVVPWNLTNTGTAAYDVEALRALVKTHGNVRMIVLNAPQNPTGWLPNHDEWSAIIDIARKAGAFLFSDEMYRFLERTPEERLPAAVESYERGVTLGGLSKALGAPGLRAGWIASVDKDVIESVAQQKDYTTICGAGPAEVLGTMILRRRDAITAENLAIVRRNIESTHAFAKTLGARVHFDAPRAGCTALLRVDTSAAALCDELFARESTLALPSTVFGFGDSHVRLGLGRRAFPEALEKLRAVLS